MTRVAIQSRIRLGRRAGAGAIGRRGRVDDRTCSDVDLYRIAGSGAEGGLAPYFPHQTPTWECVDGLGADWHLRAPDRLHWYLQVPR
jgi:hypothetical protein